MSESASMHIRYYVIVIFSLPQFKIYSPHLLTTAGQLRILDMACGKGGDLGKWIRYKPTLYVGMDVARQSLKDLTERILASSNWNGVPVVLVEADLANIDETFRSAPLVWTSKDKRWKHDEEVAEQLSRSQFDVVSMQFALHYMARSEDTMRRFLFFIASKLRPGGQFIATAVDARVVCEMLMGNSEEIDGGASRKCTLKDKRGRELLRITFPGGVFKQILRRNANVRENGSSFGIMYNFVLAEKGSCEDCAVEAPEWLLPLPELVRLADEAGLGLVRAENFHEFYEARTTGPFVPKGFSLVVCVFDEYMCPITYTLGQIFKCTRTTFAPFWFLLPQHVYAHDPLPVSCTFVVVTFAHLHFSSLDRNLMDMLNGTHATNYRYLPIPCILT